MVRVALKPGFPHVGVRHDHEAGVAPKRSAAPEPAIGERVDAPHSLATTEANMRTIDRHMRAASQLIAHVRGPGYQFGNTIRRGV
jgi:hypothetical protein